MFDVIMYLFESYMQIDQTVDISAHQLTDQLLEEGFQKNDINKALAWLDNLSSLQQQNSQNNALPAKETSQRIYSDIEQQRLNSDCRGYIAYLEQAKILNTYTREVVIDCAMSLELDTLPLYQLKWLILLVLFNDPRSNDAFLQLESMLLDFEDGLIH
jgi:Smg protein